MKSSIILYSFSFHKFQFNNEAQLVLVLTTNLQVISSNPARAFVIFTHPTDFKKIFWLNIVKLEILND